MWVLTNACSALHTNIKQFEHVFKYLKTSMSHIFYVQMFYFHLDRSDLIRLGKASCVCKCITIFVTFTDWWICHHACWRLHIQGCMDAGRQSIAGSRLWARTSQTSRPPSGPPTCSLGPGLTLSRLALSHSPEALSSQPHSALPFCQRTRGRAGGQRGL